MKYGLFKSLFVTVLLGGVWIMLIIGCKKQDNFLNTKPNEALAVPSTLQDLQNLLNNEDIFNRNDPTLGMVSSDDYYVPSTVWATLSTPEERNSYIWARQIYSAGETGIGDWNFPYNMVYYSNSILDALPSIHINSTQQNQYNQIKGTALFFRSYAFYNLMQIFTLPSDSSASSTSLGIPLRLSSDLNKRYIRSSEKECYDRILLDLQTAVTLLPLTSPHLTQPTAAAANALLTRVCLAQGNYTYALQYANATLSYNNNLVDYNTLSSTPSSFKMTSSNTYLSEDIFHATLGGYTITNARFGIVDTTLYKSYDSADLRKILFFNTAYDGNPRFRGSYELTRTRILFSGLATDEIYLARAECYARLGNTLSAIKDLNTLLVNRYKTGTFIPLTVTDNNTALNLIITERRKELLFRGTRWTDMRRLFHESRFAKTITRTINGIQYSLPPNDPRYALPIPEDEILLSGIQQNVR